MQARMPFKLAVTYLAMWLPSWMPLHSYSSWANSSLG